MGQIEDCGDVERITMNTIENISLSQEVNQSIKTHGIVSVDATGCRISDIMSQLSVMSGVEDADYSEENDGTYDVCGTRDGDNFRLRVTCNK
jgi:hypothetical protein